jgi:hypothetical protein
MSNLESLIGKKIVTKLVPLGEAKSGKVWKDPSKLSRDPHVSRPDHTYDIMVTKDKSRYKAYEAWDTNSGVRVWTSISKIEFDESLSLLYCEKPDGSKLYKNLQCGKEFALPRGHKVHNCIGKVAFVRDVDGVCKYLFNIETGATTSILINSGLMSNNYIIRDESADGNVRFTCAITGDSIGVFPASKCGGGWHNNFLFIREGSSIICYKLVREEYVGPVCMMCAKKLPEKPTHVLVPCGHTQVCEVCVKTVGTVCNFASCARAVTNIVKMQ